MHYLADKNDQLKKKIQNFYTVKARSIRNPKKIDLWNIFAPSKKNHDGHSFCSTCCTYLANFANLALPYCSGSSFYLGEFRPILKWVIALLGDFNALLYSSLLDVPPRAATEALFVKRRSWKEEGSCRVLQSFLNDCRRTSRRMVALLLSSAELWIACEVKKSSLSPSLRFFTLICPDWKTSISWIIAHRSPTK